MVEKEGEINHGKKAKAQDVQGFTEAGKGREMNLSPILALMRPTFTTQKFLAEVRVSDVNVSPYHVRQFLLEHTDKIGHSKWGKRDRELNEREHAQKIEDSVQFLRANGYDVFKCLKLKTPSEKWQEAIARELTEKPRSATYLARVLRVSRTTIDANLRDMVANGSVSFGSGTGNRRMWSGKGGT